MTYQTLLVRDMTQGLSITFNRLKAHNSLNKQLLLELNEVLEKAKEQSGYSFITLQGQQGLFCTGMDLKEFTEERKDTEIAALYMTLLKTITQFPKIIISLVDGTVKAGGVGIVAASDIVIATQKSTFSLPEALWGLLPANVLPYLIRRIGYQKAYLMTLTMRTVNATDAYAMHLVDELTDQVDEVLRKYILNFSRLHEETIYDLKKYFRNLWFIDDAMEKKAIFELTRLMQEPRIQKNIKNYIEQGKLPWEI